MIADYCQPGARREHFHSVYIGMSDKRLALRHLCSTHDIEPAQIACVFDDVNDLGMAEMCGIRCLVHRPASPLLRQYAIAQELCDYVTGSDSSNCAVREVCELFLGLLGIFDSVVASRMAYDDSYRDFFAQRQADTTRVFIQQAGEIEQREREE